MSAFRKNNFRIEVLERSLLCALSVVCGMSVAACGGGGSGSSQGDSSGASAYGVRILHGSIDAAPVDLVGAGSDSVLISQVAFTRNKGYRRVPAGNQALSLTRAFSPSQVVDSVSVVVSSESRHSVLLYGDVETFGLRTAVFEDVGPVDFLGSLVRVVNGATGAAALQAEVGQAVATVEFGGASTYLPIASGASVPIRIIRRVDGLPVVQTQVSLDDGVAYTFFVAGEVSYYVRGELLRDN